MDLRGFHPLRLLHDALNVVSGESYTPTERRLDRKQNTDTCWHEFFSKLQDHLETLFVSETSPPLVLLRVSQIFSLC